MKYNVSVTLTPLEYYFFGAENRHTDGTEKYLQRSLRMPQQTTLLGAMRFLLLQNAGGEVFADGKIQNEDKAAELIGPKSFDIDNTKGFGKIEALSEVLLWKGEFYCPLRAWEDRFEKKRKDKKRPLFTRLVIDESGTFFFDKDFKKKAVNLPEYKAKDGACEYWINKSGQYLCTDEIFLKKEHAGNCKNKSSSPEDGQPENDEDAYFKMNYYTLNKGFSFVFNMKLTDDNLINDKLINKKHIILVGGEQSYFLCEIDKIGANKSKGITPEMFEGVYASHGETDFIKVILTSDAFTRKNIYEKPVFMESSVQKMRFLKTKTEADYAYHNLGGYKSKSKKFTEGFSFSELYNMLERGSILYFTNDVSDAEIESIFKNEVFQTIGYNQFYKLTKKQ